MSEAVVVGSGPNGLAAAITLARAGREVTLYEAADTVGGGTRSAEVTVPGALSDVCSAVHPFGAASPFFNRLPLARHGLEWIHPEAPLAHPLPDRPAALLERSLDATADGLGPDGGRYRALVSPVVQRWDALVGDLLAPLVRAPRAPLALATFGVRSLWPATTLARTVFRDEPGRALFAGLACHAVLPLEQPLTAAFGVMFAAVGHVAGWPVAKGGSQAIADALAGHLEELGGKIETGQPITSLAEVADSELVLLDVTPRQFLLLAVERLPPRFRRSLARFRYGTAVYKVDYALDGPIPWADERCTRAATVHVGGTMAELSVSEAEAFAGRHAERPFLIVAQQSLFDPSRVPGAVQVAWAYAHVPHGSTVDMSGRIDAQIERFAPGFRDRILARHDTAPADLERYNANYIGGDISGGSADGLQYIFRPRPTLMPYATPLEGVYLCSSSTPPGGGVHGMCGYHAARAALHGSRRRRRR